MATTLADIARLAGVSTAAVSLALNDKKGVSPETRDRILAIVEETGYRVNRLGRALRQSRTGSVGLYMPNSAIHFGYYTETTLGVAETLHRHDRSLLILPSAAQHPKIDSFPPVDGYILVEPHSDDQGVRAILEQELPVVSGDRPGSDFPPPWGVVESPNRSSTRAAFDRFLAGGAERPGLILLERLSAWARELESAYREWAAERGLTPRVTVISIHQSNEEITELLGDWFAPGSGCDAVLAGGDGIAVRIAGILRALGHRVGEDVRLISGVDGPLMAFHTPRITAIDLQPRAFGRACAELLLELLDAPRSPEPVRRLIEAPLVARESG